METCLIILNETSGILILRAPAGQALGYAALGRQSRPRARGPRAGLAPLGSIPHA